MTAPDICHNDLLHAIPHAAPFSREGWLFEFKYDGFRALAIKDGRNIQLLSRNGTDMAASFPELLMELREFPDIVMDGELAMLDESGRSMFEQVRRRSLTTTRTSVRLASVTRPAALFAFDLLWLKGRDLREKRLFVRKELLQRILPPERRIKYLTHVEEHGLEYYKQINHLCIEGIVAKQAASRYVAGRSWQWLQIKRPLGGKSQASGSNTCSAEFPVL
jgi:bifunctional non-homologous end joining protein LigD